MAYKIILAAGGTGGHIYPAISVAKALEALNSEVEIHFWGATRGQENTIVPKAGYPLHRVWMGRMNNNVHVVERVFTLFLLPIAILRGLLTLLVLRPKFVFGFGGHASAPLLLAASLLGVRRYIWEANAIPGLANRQLSKFVDECLLVVDGADKYMNCKKVKKVGMPVREKIENLRVSKEFGLDRKFRLFVFGGSQGSLPINKVVTATLCMHPEWLAEVDVLHQTGPRHFEAIRGEYERAGVKIDVRPYVDDMEACYSWADLVVCRGGVSTFAELAATGTPALIIPLPSAADNHQQKNAEVLKGANAGEMMLQSEFNTESFMAVVNRLRTQPEILKQWSQNAKKLHRPRAAHEIAKHLLNASDLSSGEIV